MNRLNDEHGIRCWEVRYADGRVQAGLTYAEALELASQSCDKCCCNKATVHHSRSGM